MQPARDLRDVVDYWFEKPADYRKYSCQGYSVSENVRSKMKIFTFEGAGFKFSENLLISNLLVLVRKFF